MPIAHFSCDPRIANDFGISLPTAQAGLLVNHMGKRTDNSYLLWTFCFSYEKL
jgi:hypothetical protein